MIEPFNQHLIQQCSDIFHQDMPTIQNQNIPDLAAYIVLGHGKNTVEKILDELMRQDVSIHTLLHALIASQLVLLESPLSMMIKKPHESDVQALKSYVEHIHYIATTMFFIDEKNRRKNAKTKEINISQNMQTFNDSLRLWRKEDKIKCINYYKGLPIQCVANIDTITESEDSFISLTLSHDLLRVLTMTQETSVLLQSSSEGVMLQLNVHILGHRTVTLTSKNLVILKRREQLRLQPLETIEILILQHKKAVGSAKVLDFSITHLNVKLSSHHCQNLHADELVDIHTTLQGEVIHATAWIRSIRQDESHHILCLKLLPNAQIQHFLQSEFSTLQRKIIQEIKAKCALL